MLDWHWKCYFDILLRMRSIVALAVVLLALLVLLGPEGRPGDQGDCARDVDEVCLGEGRLKVRVRDATGRQLGGGAAGFGFDGPRALDVVVRIEPATLATDPASSPAGVAQAEATDADRVFIGSLSSREIWVEVTDLEIDRTRVYHRSAGEGWGLVDVMPRRLGEPLRVAEAR